MKKISIKSSLVGKEDCFKMLALATATGMPLLINGEKGTAKTATVLDFAKSFEAQEDVSSFIIEMSEGTKVNHLLGMPNIEKLTVDRKWEMKRPISTAKVVVINEVDKASSSIRNAMLSIMAEKKIFDGDDVVDCVWDTFVATSNAIPAGEENSPFYDRLPLRYNMGRVTISDKLKFMRDKSVKEVMTLNIPSFEEIEATELNYDYIQLMMELIESNKALSISDRTLTKLDTLVKASMHIWDSSETDAVLKIAEIVAPLILTDLGSKLLPKLITSFKGYEEMFHKAYSQDSLINLAQPLMQMYSLLAKMENDPKQKRHYPEYLLKYKEMSRLKELKMPVMEDENPF